MQTNGYLRVSILISIKSQSLLMKCLCIYIYYYYQISSNICLYVVQSYSKLITIVSKGGGATGIYLFLLKTDYYNSCAMLIGPFCIFLKPMAFRLSKIDFFHNFLLSMKFFLSKTLITRSLRSLVNFITKLLSVLHRD